MAYIVHFLYDLFKTCRNDLLCRQNDLLCRSDDLITHPMVEQKYVVPTR